MRKVHKGERLKIPAEAYNAFVDSARRDRDSSLSLTRGLHGTNSDAGVVFIKNASGADCDRFGILAVDSPLFLPTDNETAFKNQIVLAGVTPSTETDTGRFVVLLEPVPDSKIGRGLLSGICPVKVDVQNEDDKYADINDGVTTCLKSRFYGAAQILWKESGTGEKWAVVRLGAYSPPFGLVVASDAANYCWLDEEHPGDTNPGEFVVADGEYKKHALIHSDYLLGEKSLPLKQVIIDIACTSSSWTRGLNCYAQGEPHEEIGQYFLNVSVAPVLVDFDPTDISWNDAYVTGGGLLTGNIGSWAAYNHLEDYLVLEATPITGEPPESSAQVSISSKFPNLFAAKHSEVGPTYLQADDICGFLVTLGLSGQVNQEAEWVGGAGETFVLLEV